MTEHDNETPSHRVERGKTDDDAEVRDEQSELSLGAMTRGAVGTEGVGKDREAHGPESGSSSADVDRREAGA